MADGLFVLKNANAHITTVNTTANPNPYLPEHNRLSSFLSPVSRGPMRYLKFTNLAKGLENEKSWDRWHSHQDVVLCVV